MKVDYLIIVSSLIKIIFLSLIKIKFLCFTILIPIKSFKKNRFFIFFNIINLTIIIYYNVMIFIKSSYDYNYPIILIHTSLSLLSTFILLIYSRALINQIKKIQMVVLIVLPHVLIIIIIHFMGNINVLMELVVQRKFLIIL